MPLSPKMWSFHNAMFFVHLYEAKSKTSLCSGMSFWVMHSKKIGTLPSENVLKFGNELLSRHSLILVWLVTWVRRSIGTHPILKVDSNHTILQALWLCLKSILPLPPPPTKKIYRRHQLVLKCVVGTGTHNCNLQREHLQWEAHRVVFYVPVI